MSWDPAKSMLFYRARKYGSRESWTRRPSPEEWSSFWRAMDQLAVWGWKQDYGDATHTDCTGWSVSLKHAGKSLNSRGCSVFPDRGWKEFVAEVTRLRGGPEAATVRARERDGRQARGIWGESLT